MKYLILAYGNEREWNALTKPQQDELLAEDERLRKRGAIVAAVSPTATTVRAWEGVPQLTDGPVTELKHPLAGFGIIEAADFNQAVELVKNTPCARAGGAVEIRPITAINDEALRE